MKPRALFEGSLLVSNKLAEFVDSVSFLSSFIYFSFNACCVPEMCPMWICGEGADGMD